MLDLAKLVDMREGTQRSEIFSNASIYELELERIFARCWLFLTHEGQIPKAGDYVRTMMGEDEVIVVRQRDGTIKAFINACRHRNAQLCTAEAGNARNFICNYHGWGYSIDGKLNHIPLEKELYKGRLDKCTLGLREVPLVEEFHGFVYGCFDPLAPSLLEYLGEMAWYLEAWMEASGGVELVGPPSRSFLKCNWKIPSENFCADAYHVGWTHGAALKALGAKPHRVGNKQLPADGAGIQVTTRHGHGLGIVFDPGSATLGPVAAEIEAWQARKRAQVVERLGEKRARFYGYHINSTIFPNNSYLWGTNTFKVWNPRGPDGVEVLTWTIVEKDMPNEMKEKIATAMNRLFGTAGMLEADDADNMESISLLNRGYMTRQGHSNSQMAMGEEREDSEMPGVVSDCALGELGYRGFYRFYQELLDARDWNAVKGGDLYWKSALLQHSLTEKKSPTDRAKV